MLVSSADVMAAQALRQLRCSSILSETEPCTHPLLLKLAIKPAAVDRIPMDAVGARCLSCNFVQTLPPSSQQLAASVEMDAWKQLL